MGQVRHRRAIPGTDHGRGRLGRPTRLVASLVMSFGLAGAAESQTRSGCGSPQPPSIGVAVGRSLPYLEFESGAVAPPGSGSVTVRGGAQFVGRADLPVVGPLRLRIEAARARWDVRQTTYDPAGFTVSEDTSVGHMSARHLVGMVGLRVGRAPACAHVSAGGGFYSLAFRDATVRRPGVALSAGIEVPTGVHGAIQVDGVLHLIGTRSAYPIAFTTVPALNLLVGWAFRF